MSDEPRLWTPKGWHAFEDGAAMAAACADRVAAIVESAIAERGHAVVAFPGGSTPVPAFELLAGRPLDWENVTILPGDDRIVDQADPLSNFAMLERYFGGTGARLIPLVDDVALGATHAESANRRLADLPWPPDLVWLGVGGGGKPGNENHGQQQVPRGYQVRGDTLHVRTPGMRSTAGSPSCLIPFCYQGLNKRFTKCGVFMFRQTRSQRANDYGQKTRFCLRMHGRTCSFGLIWRFG